MTRLFVTGSWTLTSETTFSPGLALCLGLEQLRPPSCTSSCCSVWITDSLWVVVPQVNMFPLVFTRDSCISSCNWLADNHLRLRVGWPPDTRRIHSDNSSQRFVCSFFWCKMFLLKLFISDKRKCCTCICVFGTSDLRATGRCLLLWKCRLKVLPRFWFHKQALKPLLQSSWAWHWPGTGLILHRKRFWWRGSTGRWGWVTADRFG